MPLYMAWAGSPATLGRRSVRFCFFDEVDKFDKFSGDDAPPIELGSKRVQNYTHRARILIGSTPTTRDGAVFQAYEGCTDKRAYYVPCPHCQHYQILTFTQLKWDSEDVKAIEDKSKQADYVNLNNKAYYQCIACDGTITDKHKMPMLLKGVWLSETQTIDKQGVISGERPAAKRIGFHLSAMYSPWVTFSQMAAQFLRSQNNYGRLMEFKNQWLGEIFESIDTSYKQSDLMSLKAEAPAANLVPKWAGCLIATADIHNTEKGFRFVVRAHGRDDRSQLVHHGTVKEWDDLYNLCLNSNYQIDGTKQTMQPSLMFVDAGWRTQEVYEFSHRDKRIRPVIGARQDPKDLIKWSMPDGETQILLGSIKTPYFKDKLATLREKGTWLINNQITDTYAREMAGEHRVVDPESGKITWEKVTAGAQNHFFDCEVYQLAAAHFLNTNALPDEATLVAQRNISEADIKQLQEQKAFAAMRQQQTNYLAQTAGLNSTSSWLKPTNKWR